MNKTVFIDMETTHLDIEIAQPIQIALIAVEQQTLNIIDTLEVKIHFEERLASAFALERNGYDPIIWQEEAINSNVALPIVSKFLIRHATWQRTSKKGNPYTTCEIAGHNVASYDAPILQRWCGNRFCPAATWATGPVDTMHMARCLDWLQGHPPHPGGYSLGALCRRYDIKNDNEHDALCDVAATVELAKKLRPTSGAV